MALEDYRRKRKFAETPEPAGRARRSDRSRIFVVQKHAARRLHYDARLAIGGVVASMAVPRGDFEGVIPAGHYGAGTVMVWDKGTYEPKHGIPPDKELAQGKIDVELHGAKLRSGFSLVRPAMRSAAPGAMERWLLIKHRDAYADPAWDVEDPALDRSVLTGRSMHEIEGGRPKEGSRRPRARG
jgi:bifunctional non-homologous end joining protein LigD